MSAVVSPLRPSPPPPASAPWVVHTPGALLALGGGVLAKQPKLFKGGYAGNNPAHGMDMLCALGAGVGLVVRGDRPTEPPPWYADPIGYSYSSLALAVGHLADACRHAGRRKALDRSVLEEIGTRIGVASGDPLAGEPGDAFDRHCISTWSDYDYTNKQGALKVFAAATRAAVAAERRQMGVAA